MQVDMKLLVAQTVGLFLVFALVLFLPAGTVAWPAGWTFIVMFFSFFLGVNAWLIRRNPGLVQERLHLGTSDQQSWDKLFFPIMLFFFVAWLILIPLDTVRFKWSSFPIWLQVAGAVVLLCSFYIFFLTFRENSYLSPVVRIQEDRGHSVISTGPYHYVRHPMYSGMVIFVIGTSLMLGSWYGVLFGLIPVVGVARRAMLEERTLRIELPGCEAYMDQVRYRLIPRIW